MPVAGDISFFGVQLTAQQLQEDETGILVIFALLFADLTFTKLHYYIFLHFLNEDL